MREKILTICALALCSQTALAQGTQWTIGPRSLPTPSAASSTFRESIAATPQPDVTAHINATPTSNEQWIQLYSERDLAGAEAASELAALWSTTITEEQIAGVTVRWVTPAEVDPEHENHLFVHLHGGAYVFNRGLAGTLEATLIAHRARVRVVSVDYRMPPEHPFPAALEDAVAVWRALLESRPAKSLALGGTSAGAGLTLAAVHRIMELGLETPGALWIGTPWADLTKTGDSLFTNEGVDRLLVSYDGLLETAARLYANGRELTLPLISPVYGDFAGFPPTYLVSGTRDLFLSHTVRVHRRMRQAGVAADLNIYEGLSHGDYAFVTDSAESEEVFTQLGLFLRQHLE